jgi:purine nucleoside phosphorylase
MVIAIFAPFTVDGDLVDTPFGKGGPLRAGTLGGQTVLWFRRGGDPRARVVAAKACGAVHAIGLGAATALPQSSASNLSPGDWLTPDDAIDQTRGTPTTFFTHSGLGYLSQSPPFCPETRAAVVAAGVLDGGIAIAAPLRAIAPAEVRAWGILGGTISMPGLAPEWYLCHELEIGYAPLCRVCWVEGKSHSFTEAEARPLIEKIVALLPETHSWAGSNAAARRELGDDWQRWIGEGKEFDV